jgi:protein-tyrosine phosphatase
MRLLLLVISIALVQPVFSQISDSNQRHVLVSGAVNFRDIGGYTTRDGHHVRWDRIYRSADISKLTSSDLDTLRARHICYDVDLRGVAESAAAPDKINPGTDYILCPAGSDSTNTSMRRAMGLTSGGDSLMESWYANITYLAARYKPFFAKLLALPDSDALVFHCTAGKDRTGIAAALLLYALDVPYDRIVDDYAATNYYRAGDNDRLTHVIATSMHLDPKVAAAMMAAKPEYLDATFDAIKRQYGSIDKYLSDELGVDDAARARLKAKFLE